MLKITIEIDDKQNVTVNTIAPKTEKPAPIRKNGKKHGTVESRNCSNCGTHFKPTSNVQKYCSIGCRPVKAGQTTNKEITPEQIERSKGKPYKDY